jgi:FkbM family methyltransferase
MQPTLMERALPLVRAAANVAQRLLLPLGLRMSRKVEGHRVRFDPGTDIGMHLLLRGRFEPEAIARCAAYVRADGVILDIGANIGVHAVQFADLVPEGKVVCFEPARATFEYLLRNVARLENVVPINAALSDAPGLLSFFVAADNAYSSLKDTQRKPILRRETVACFRADDLLVPLLEGARIDLVKIDVEGFERQVLEGMQAILARHRPVVFCEIFGGGHSNPDPQGTLAYVRTLGYEPFVLDGAGLRAVATHDDRFYNYFLIPTEGRRA